MELYHLSFSENWCCYSYSSSYGDPDSNLHSAMKFVGGLRPFTMDQPNLTHEVVTRVLTHIQSILRDKLIKQKTMKVNVYEVQVQQSSPVAKLGN